MPAISISHLKQRARELKRTGTMSHCRALHYVARENGYPHWKALLASSAQAFTLVPAHASVSALPLPQSNTHIFHRVRIEDQVFEGWVAVDGPCIVHPGSRGAVPLGEVCRLANLTRQPGADHRDSAGIVPSHDDVWWLTKYDDQPRVRITLGDLGRKALVREFGIPLAGDYAASAMRSDAFYASPVFQALAKWAHAHPRIARRISRTSPYLPEWYERALAAIEVSA